MNISKHFITIHMQPLFWGLCGLMSAIITLQSSVVAALWLLFGFCGLTRVTPISQNMRIIILASMLLGGIRYQTQLFTFDTFYQQNTEQKNMSIGLLEDVSIVHAIDDAVKTPYTLKLLVYAPKQKMRLFVTVPLHYPYTHLRGGMCIELPPHTYKKSNNKAFNRYLMKTFTQASVFLFKIPKRMYCSDLSRANKMYQWILNKKEHLFCSIQKNFSKPTAYLISLIFLGKTPFAHAQNRDIRENFGYWGLLHMIARSGLHLVIFFSVLGFLLAFFGLSPKTKLSFTLILTYGYALFSWLSLSFIRAVLSATLTAYAQIRGHITRPIDILTLTTYIFLIANPVALFFLDFQLSFGLTAILCWLSELEKAT
ncbi:MAG: hypothetical protein UU47_C0001G0122 [candidate division TM6 bacterium GW2011_GWE2_41_16]|nr:MAG: hypothetical protein UU47_C0001G0122 [candidate division TM6 bacterium GW2011_GWE2_41_16]